MTINSLKSTEIADFEYQGREDITEVQLTKDITVIGAGAFCNCPHLKKVVLGKQVTLVKEGAFANCPELEYFEYAHDTAFEKFCLAGSPSLRDLVEGDVHTRAFFFPVDFQYAITCKNEKLSTPEYEVYEGRMADMDGFPRSVVHKDYPVLYFVVITEDGVEYSWFNVNLDWAITCARFKASGKSYNEFFGVTLGPNSRLDWRHCGILLGVCDNGHALWNIGVQYLGYDVDGQPTVREVSEFLKTLDPELYTRFTLSVGRAPVAIPPLRYDKMLSGAQFMRQLKHLLTSEGKFVSMRPDKITRK